MPRAVQVAAFLGAVAGAIARARLNVMAAAGILSMSWAAWILCGPGYALATFGGFTWITTVIAADLAARGKGSS